MRKIKFRAWDKKVRRFVSNCNYHIDLNGDVFWEFAYNEPQFVSKDELELMQYTGLHDKNGKEIYEGDILKDDDSIRLECVVWDCASWWEKDIKADTLMYPLCREIAYKTVIGNIYENPELLEVSNGQS